MQSSIALQLDRNSNDDHDQYSSTVYIVNHTLDSPRHSLETHIHWQRDTALSKLSFVPPLLSPPTANFSAAPKNKPVHSRQRSLTETAFATAICDEMNVFASEAPGSPPGLTTSKSSKSSTNRSSSISGTDGLLSDNAHFEDIGLDEGDSLPLTPKSMNGLDAARRPPPRMAATTMNGYRSNAAAMATMRDLTNQEHRPPYPQPSNSLKAHAPTHSLSLPHPRPMRNGLRNTSTPSLAITAMSNYNRSRSPSPQSPASPLSKPLYSPSSPRRPGLAGTQTQQIPVRSGSWQPRRKSLKELEAEYNDSDEDLPDEASLWNVPLSPRPPSERTAPISVTTSPRISPCASPERSSPLRTSIGMDGKEVMAPKSAPIIAARRTLPASFPSPPISPRRLLRGASTGTMPDHPAFARTKSWNLALSELSEETQALTEALENHTVAAETKHEFAVQNGDRPSMDRLSRAKTSSSIELPPLRVNNIMIDPLPISKEKEKVLSRTRPSWLPPKSQKEEKKHLKEYQRMMELSVEAERRKAASVAADRCTKDDSQSSLLRIWEEHVLPNWDQVIREPRTRELWWRGVAPKSRAQVWQRAIGNDLALTEVTYQKALQRAKVIRTEIDGKPRGEENRKESAWFDAIHRDVKHTFPDLNIFQTGAPLHDGLVDVLMAYSMYRSDVGYSHGTHLMAAFLSLTMATPYDTFLALSNLLNRPLPLAFLTGDSVGTEKAYNLTLSLLEKKYPRLHRHLFGSSASPSLPANNTDSASSSHQPALPLHLTPSSVLEPLMRTLFLSPGHQGLGIDIAARVWDVMVFDGDAAIIRTTVAILGALEGRLYGSREEVLSVLGWRGDLDPRGQGLLGDEESFMARVRAVGKSK